MTLPPCCCFIKLFLSEWNEGCPNPLAWGRGLRGLGKTGHSGHPLPRSPAGPGVGQVAGRVWWYRTGPRSPGPLLLGLRWDFKAWAWGPFIKARGPALSSGSWLAAWPDGKVDPPWRPPALQTGFGLSSPTNLAGPVSLQAGRANAGGVGDWGPCPQVFLVLGELLLSCNWAVVADILLVRVGAGPRAS